MNQHKRKINEQDIIRDIHITMSGKRNDTVTMVSLRATKLVLHWPSI